MKTGDIKEFLKVHRDKADIRTRTIHMTDEQVRAVEYLAADQGVSFEDMAMTLVQYQLQAIEAIHRADIQYQATRN